MREIKFRAWDKENKIMLLWINSILFEYKNPSISLTSRDGIHNSQEWDVRTDIELMQFTGLKDKNGKEIYEGDIVECFDEKCGGTIGKEEWSRGLFYRGQIEFITCAYYINCYNDGFHKLHSFKDGELEIIGNIYENPEILK